jgi:hypothetical protein
MGAEFYQDAESGLAFLAFILGLFVPSSDA